MDAHDSPHDLTGTAPSVSLAIALRRLITGLFFPLSHRHTVDSATSSFAAICSTFSRLSPRYSLNFRFMPNPYHGNYFRASA